MEEAKILLEEQLDKLKNTTPRHLESWISETTPVIAEIFKEGSAQYKQFINTAWYVSSYTEKHIEEFQDCLKGFINCLRLRKSPIAVNSRLTKEGSSNPSVIINNNPSFSQSQEQSQSQMVNLKDILEDELPRARMKEIEAISKADELKEAKLVKIGEVLQKTGAEVLASTLAKIITTSMGIY